MSNTSELIVHQTLAFCSNCSRGSNWTLTYFTRCNFLKWEIHLWCSNLITSVPGFFLYHFWFESTVKVSIWTACRTTKDKSDRKVTSACWANYHHLQLIACGWCDTFESSYAWTKHRTSGSLFLLIIPASTPASSCSHLWRPIFSFGHFQTFIYLIKLHCGFSFSQWKLLVRDPHKERPLYREQLSVTLPL